MLENPNADPRENLGLFDANPIKWGVRKNPVEKAAEKAAERVLREEVAEIAAN